MPGSRLLQGRLLARSTSEGTKPIDIPLDYLPASLAVSPAGDLLFATGYSNQTLSIIRTADNARKTLNLGRDGAAMAISPNGTLYMGSPVEDLLVVSAGGGDARVREVIPTDGPVWDVAMTPDGEKLFLAMGSQGVKRLSVRSRELAWLTHSTCPEFVEIDPQGKRLFVPYQCSGPEGRPGHDSVEVFDVQSEKSLGIIHGYPMVGGKPGISPDGRLAMLDGEDACGAPQYDHVGCPAVPSRVLHLIRAEDRQHLKTLSYAGPGSPAYFLDNSRYLTLGYSISVFDTERAGPLEMFEAADHRVFRSAAFAPDGRRVYIGYGGAEGTTRGAGGVRVLAVESKCDAAPAGIANLYAGDGTFGGSAGLDPLVPKGGVSFAGGRVGQAFYFDGSGFLSGSARGHWSNVGEHDASVVLYAKLADDVGDQVLFDWSSEEPARGIRLLRSTDHFEFQMWPGGTPARSKSLLKRDTWYHIAVTKSSREVTLYINGIAEDHQSPAPPFVALTRPLTLGSDGQGGPSFHGWLDEIGYYPRALTAKEVWDLYELRESGACKP